MIRWKQFTAALLVVLLLAMCVPTVSAANAHETESNDTMATANALSLNTAITGNVYESTDRDFYVFNLSEDGYVTLRFTHAMLSEGEWTVEIRDVKSTVYYTMDSGCVDTDLSSLKYGLPAGKYYIVVARTPWGDWSDTDYTLTVNFTASRTFETEFNASYAEADALPLNTAMQGNLCKSSDEDYYAFDLAEDGYVTLHFAHEMLSEGEWTVKIKDVKDTVYYTLESDCTDINLSSPRCGLPAGRYYIVVSRTPWGDWSDVEYTLRVSDGAVSLGDLNGDQSVDSSDARIVLQAAVGKIQLTDEQKQVADVNGDGQVDSSDARMILQAAVGKITL